MKAGRGAGLGCAVPAPNQSSVVTSSEYSVLAGAGLGLKWAPPRPAPTRAVPCSPDTKHCFLGQVAL